VVRVAVEGVVLEVICGRDLGEKGGNHFYNIANRHTTDIVFHLL
jgi:hypothetical protein